MQAFSSFKVLYGEDGSYLAQLVLAKPGFIHAEQVRIWVVGIRQIEIGASQVNGTFFVLSVYVSRRKPSWWSGFMIPLAPV